MRGAVRIWDLWHLAMERARPTRTRTLGTRLKGNRRRLFERELPNWHSN